MADYKLGQFQRNHYFYGKLMAVKDFEVEQSYMNEKRHLLTRLISGAGIVCGLDDVEVYTDEGKVKIKFTSGGAAIDPGGREIIVPPESDKEVFIKEGETTVNLTRTELETSVYYVYLEYNPVFGEPVNSAANPSSCEETCCPNRIIEDFEVVASKNHPEPGAIVCPNLSGNINEDTARGRIKDWFESETSNLCSPGDESRVFLFALESSAGGVSKDDEKTDLYLSSVHNSKLFAELLTCHLADFGNPHKTTAAQVGALKSVDGVRNDGGNVDLVQDNSITITPNDTTNTITIGETHSEKDDNPHHVTAQQVGALVSVDGVANPGGNVDLAAQNSISITPDDTANTITIGETHSARNDNPHHVTAQQVGAIAGVGGIGNPGGDVDLVAQNSISITPDPVALAVVIGETHSSRTDNPHMTTAEQVDALSTKGGFVTGPIHIRTKEWNALTGEATKTYGLMGRLTEDLDTGSDYRTAGVVGISEISGKHGVYAKAPEVSHALYVEGAALFTGPKTGYVVDIFKNASGKTLKTGDVVKLKGTPISRFFGDNDKIPVPEVTFAEEENDNRIIGIVDRKAVPDNEESAVKEKPGAFASIKNGEELYVVTLGTYAHCKVDAANAPIDVGDLLTSAKNPGHAQKAEEPQIGTIIGKALEPLKEGTGSIAVFVNIQ